MARKLKSMERDFWFNLNEGGVGTLFGTAFIDLAQVGSLVNRVSLRQGMEYVVESIELHCNGKAQAAIYRLPEDWSCLNAWEKTFHAWKDQQQEAAREAGLSSTEARYNDFKIHMNELHKTTGFANNLLPVGYDITLAATNYEWRASAVVVPNDGGVAGNTVEYHVHMLGEDAASKGMVKAYGQSRSRPFAADPNVVDVPQGGLFGEMIDVGEIQEDVITNLQDNNNNPPYVIANQTGEEYYPCGENQANQPWNTAGFTFNGQLEDILSVNAGYAVLPASRFGVQSDTMGGFVAPCGLLAVDYYAEGLTDTPSGPFEEGYFPSLLLRVTLAPGGYKGLLAQSMQEAN